MSRSETSHSWLIIHWASTSGEFLSSNTLSWNPLAWVFVESKLAPQSFGGVSLVGHFSELLLLKSDLSLKFFMSLLNSSLRVLLLGRWASLPVRLILNISRITTVSYNRRSVTCIGVTISFLGLSSERTCISSIICLRVVTFRRLS